MDKKIGDKIKEYKCLISLLSFEKFTFTSIPYMKYSYGFLRPKLLFLPKKKSQFYFLSEKILNYILKKTMSK